MVFSFEEVTFFFEDGQYYFSPQADYPALQEDPENYIYRAHYLYLPQVGRWMQQREGQLLFAVGLSEEEILACFPSYGGEIPWVTRAVVICSETVWLEDVTVEISGDLLTQVTEIRGPNPSQIFTPDDVMVIAVDHVRFPSLYYRYLDTDGNAHRQYVLDQFMDSNNGGITNALLAGDDDYYTLIPVE